MRVVIYTDERGIMHRSLIRDQDPDSMAESGIPDDPPDVIGGIDWDSVAVELHNLLIQRGVINWDTAVRMQNGLSSAILSVLKPKVVQLYRNT